jgi:catechol 2,3-dioxygenase-like lactoylglutathione lyase family enzyme
MGTLSEIAFFTDNVDKMAAFYEQFLNTEPVARSEGMAIFMMNDTKLFIHQMYEVSKGELPPENHMAFTVANVDTAVSDLEARGLSLEIPPEDYYWGRSAYLRDPDGHLWELTQQA